jgi:hypothetical protein
MNTKISLLLVLILLVVLILFYYIDLESNIIILLSATIVILLHNVITKREHFSVQEKASSLDAKIDLLISVAKALQSRTQAKQSADTGAIEGVDFDYSCPFEPSTVESDAGIATGNQQQGIDLRFVTKLDGITPQDLANALPNSSSNSD